MAETNKLVTGKYSHKQYKCPDCGHEHSVGTNHWGEIYSKCPKCAWSHPMGNSPQQCLESPPEGYGVPEKWQTVTLGELVTIQRGITLK